MFLRRSLLPQLSVGDADADSDESVRLESVRMFCQREAGSHIAIGLALAVAALFSTQLQHGWTMILIIGLRLGSEFSCWHHCNEISAKIARQESFENHMPALERVRFVVGASWGLMLWPLPADFPHNVAAVCIVFIVLFAGLLVMSNSALIPRLLLFTVTGFGLTTILAQFSNLDEKGILPLLGMIAYVMAVPQYARYVARQALDVVRVKVENQSLADKLTCANAELEQALAMAVRLGQEDSLTGLFNRRAFLKNIQSLPALGKGQDRYLLLIDLDHFKSINDRFGHCVGDAVLKRAAIAIQSIEDCADLCARWGGEEFLMLVSKSSREQVVAHANQLRASIAVLSLDDLHPALSVSASIGIAVWQTGGSLDDAIANADRAMYLAKQEGRDQVRLAA